MSADTYRENGVFLGEHFGVSYPEAFGHPLAEYRNHVTGETGLQVIAPSEWARLMRDHLIQSGRAEDRALVGRAAWNMRRVEAGLPWFGEKPSGRVTSAVFSPKLQSPLFMGYVRAGLAETGQDLLLSLGGADIVLTVTPLPVE